VFLPARGAVRPVGRDASARSVLAWFAPDLALTVATATLIYLCISLGGASALFRDADAGWHIRIGERIISAGRLPAADSFSFSRSGAPGICWEWLLKPRSI
jgi:hypothetical protein